MKTLLCIFLLLLIFGEVQLVLASCPSEIPTPGPSGLNPFIGGSLQLDAGYSYPPDTGPYLKVVTGMLNVRSCPAPSNCTIIGKAPFGSYYTIESGPYNNYWWLIDYNGSTGYVSAKYEEGRPLYADVFLVAAIRHCH